MKHAEPKDTAHKIGVVLSMLTVREGTETPEAKTRAHTVIIQVLIVLATNSLDGTCEDASRIHSLVDWDLPQGLRAETAAYCHALLKLMFSGFIEPL